MKQWQSAGGKRAWKQAGFAAGLLAAVCAGADAPADHSLRLNDLYFTALADLEYLLEPIRGSEDDPRPLCVVLPGGGGDLRASQSAMAGLGQPFVERGFAVVVPIAPEGRAFMGRNGDLVPKLIEELWDRDDILDEPVVMAGISNGGIAALQIAAEEPDMVAAVAAIPGIASGDTRMERLRDMPIYMRVGENDHLNWGQALPQVAQRLRQAGARVDAEVLAGQGHGIQVNWAELDAWLAGAMGEQAPAALRASARPPPAPMVDLRIPPAADRTARVWTSRSGSRMNAVLMQARGDAVLLQGANGRRVRIAFDQLSEADQAYLRGLQGGPGR